MRNKALESFGDLRDDEELGPADWPTIVRHITCLNNMDEGQIHPHNVGEGESYLQTMNLRDIRVRFLNGKLLVNMQIISIYLDYQIGHFASLRVFLCCLTSYYSFDKIIICNLYSIYEIRITRILENLLVRRDKRG